MNRGRSATVVLAVGATRQLASHAMRIGAARARARLSCSESDAAALPVQFSAELVAAAICCCLRCYISMPSHRRSVKSISRTSALFCPAASTASTAPASRRLRQPSPPPTNLGPEPVAPCSEASDLNPHGGQYCRRRDGVTLASKSPPVPGGHHLSTRALAPQPTAARPAHGVRHQAVEAALSPT